MDKTRIAVLGLGGVGGFVGARLSDFYKPGSDVEVSFFARGKTLEAMRAKGLRLKSREAEIVAQPAKASDSAQDLGVQDYLICAVKAYDIAGLIESISPLVGAKTVIVPFLNGVEATEKLKAAFPKNLVADACVFIVSEATAPAEIKMDMEKYMYMFGVPNQKSAPLERFEKILRDAGVRATCTENIERIVWEKFAFISPLSTLMSYVQKSFGQMMVQPENIEDLKKLLREFCDFAEAKGADVSPEMFDATFEKYKTMMPADSTTSMQRDFAAGKSNELETLAGYVIREGEALGLKLPVYEKYYKLLFRRV